MADEPGQGCVQLVVASNKPVVEELQQLGQLGGASSLSLSENDQSPSPRWPYLSAVPASTGHTVNVASITRRPTELAGRLWDLSKIAL
jgi:hypothetical protein